MNKKIAVITGSSSGIGAAKTTGEFIPADSGFAGFPNPGGRSIMKPQPLRLSLNGQLSATMVPCLK